MTSPIVRVYFGLEYAPGSIGVYDDSVRGVYDDPTYLYADVDGAGVEVQTDGMYVSIRRGRARELDEFEAGTCEVSLYNFARTYDPFNTAGTYYGDLVPGKRVDIEMYGQLIFAGTIEDWNLEWDVDGMATASFLAVDALGVLARKDFDAWTTTASQTAGPRINDILNRPEVAFGANRSIGTGISTLQGDNVTWGSRVLAYCQLVSRSDWGRFYASRQNLITFDDRVSLVGASTALTFADDGTGIPFHGVTTEVGAELLYNRVGIDRFSGTLQTANDTASQSAYGVRALSLTELLMDSDAESEQMANYLCSVYKDPTPRVSSVTVKLGDDIHLTGADQAAVASLDMGDIVGVKWTPLSIGSAIDDTFVVEGIDHDITVQEHEVTIRLSPVFQQAAAIYDDAVWGVYDSDSVYSF